MENSRKPATTKPKPIYRVLFQNQGNLYELYVRIEVPLPRDATSVRKLVGLIADQGIEVRSLVLAPQRDRFVAFLRLVTIDAPAVKATLRNAGFTVADLTDFLD